MALIANSGGKGLLLAALLTAAVPLSAAEDPLHLPIGDPSRSGRDAAVVLDGVTDTAAGDLVAVEELAARLKDVRLLLVGEEHTAMESHQAQLRVIEALTRAGRRVLLGLEMFPYGEQPALDQWSAGRLTEKEFLQQSRWYKNWGYNWRYYRDIFLFAAEARIPLYGVNAPRETISAVRKKGLEGFSAGDSAHLPARIDTESPEGLRLFRAELEGAGMHGSMTPEEWQGMFAAQCAWDATFAHNAVAALSARGSDPKVILVLLVGSGHVRYGLGAQRQAAGIFPGRIASLVTLPVRDEKGRPVRSVNAALANFVWGITGESDPVYPVTGLSTAGAEGKPLSVINVEEHSAAARAGFAVGDVIVSFDGTPVPDRETLNRLLAEKRWGDQARVQVRRSEEVLEKTMLFRRQQSATP